MASKFTPEQLQAQKSRQSFLASKGINAKDQAIAVHTLHQVQNYVIKRTDEAMLFFLRLWIPEIRGVKPSHMQNWLHQNSYIYQGVDHKVDPISRKNTDVYCLYREKTPKTPEVRVAFEICYSVTPILDPKQAGQFRVDVDHKEIPFPAYVKISKA